MDAITAKPYIISNSRTKPVGFDFQSQIMQYQNIFFSIVKQLLTLLQKDLEIYLPIYLPLKIGTQDHESSVLLVSVSIVFLQFLARFFGCSQGKVIYPKYFKHWPYTVAHTIHCVGRSNHGLIHGLFLSLFKLIPCPIRYIVYELAYFIFES